MRSNGSSNQKPEFGIAGIGVYQPGRDELGLDNEWFARHAALGKRFETRTGIRRRGISFLEEGAMALRAVDALRKQYDLDLRCCAGVVLVSPSLVPLDDKQWRRLSLRSIGDWEQLAERIGPPLGIDPAVLRGTDWRQWQEQLGDWEGLLEIARCLGISQDRVEALERRQRAALGGGLEDAAAGLAQSLGMAARDVRGTNFGCSGYVDGWRTLREEFHDRLCRSPDRYLLLLTTVRLSQRQDFGDRITGPMMGDYATATLITHANHGRYPPQLRLSYVSTATPETRDVSADAGALGRALFDVQRRRNVLYPLADGAPARDPERLCWTMDGAGVVYAALPALRSATEEALQQTGRRPAEVRWWLGNQPGKLTPQAVEDLRAGGYANVSVPFHLSAEVGNVNSSTIPHDLWMTWTHFKAGDLIAAPAMGMLVPGDSRLSQGALLFEKV